MEKQTKEHRILLIRDSLFLMIGITISEESAVIGYSNARGLTVLCKAEADHAVEKSLAVLERKGWSVVWQGDPVKHGA
jgi:hypothetical protein